MLGVSVARRHYDNRECLSGPLLGPEQGEDVTYVIGLPCVDVKDRACVEECPVDCIYAVSYTHLTLPTIYSV